MISLSSNKPTGLVGTDHPDWDEFVNAHPKGSVFHTSDMIRALDQTAGIESLPLAITNDDGRILAMLTSCHIQTLRRFPALTSRAVQFAEPICEDSPEGIAALQKLVHRHDQQMSSKSLMCEIRPISEPSLEKQPLLDHGYELKDYINYVVRLDQGKDAIWSNMNKRMRQKIRSSTRKGVEVIDDNSEEGLLRFYRLVIGSYSRAQVPLAGIELFENTRALLPPGSVRLRTAMYEGEPVASVMTLIHGDRMFSWYGGTKRINAISAFGCIVWDDIAWGCDAGLKFYDFGGAGWPHEDYGPRKFKQHFNGDEIRYGRYLKTYSHTRLRVAKFAYTISRRLGFWSKSSEPDEPKPTETQSRPAQPK